MLVGGKKYELPGDPDRDAYVIGVSGGADSSALAIMMRREFPRQKFSFVFTDTLAEPPDIYKSISALELHLDEEIVRIVPEYGLYGLIEHYNGFLPSSRSRWCTRILKIEPYEDYLELLHDGRRVVHTFAGLRADEPYRAGMRDEDRDWLHVHFPLRDFGMDRADVFSLLSETVGVPEFYRYRSRSGCEICWGMRQSEVIAAIESGRASAAESFERLSDSDAESYEIRGRDYSEDKIALCAFYDVGPIFDNSDIRLLIRGVPLYVGIEELGHFSRIVGWSTTRSGISRKLNSHYTSRIESCEVFGITQDEFRDKYRQHVALFDISKDRANIDTPKEKAFCWRRDQPISQTRQVLSEIKRIILRDDLRIRGIDAHTPKYTPKKHSSESVCFACSK